MWFRKSSIAERNLRHYYRACDGEKMTIVLPVM